MVCHILNKETTNIVPELEKTGTKDTLSQSYNSLDYYYSRRVPLTEMYEDETNRVLSLSLSLSYIAHPLFPFSTSLHQYTSSS